MLIGNVFTYAPDLDVTNCEAVAMCDCCAGHYLFVNEEEFIAIDYCVESTLYSAGTYTIQDDRIHLNFSGRQVDFQINWEDEADTLSTQEIQHTILPTDSDAFSVTLTLLDCEKNLAFDTGLEETPFAALNSNYDFNELLQQMHDEGIYSLLRLKR